MDRIKQKNYQEIEIDLCVDNFMGDEFKFLEKIGEKEFEMIIGCGRVRIILNDKPIYKILERFKYVNKKMEINIRLHRTMKF